MKITRLILENFANIYTAMNKKKIDIDFTKCKNNREEEIWVNLKIELERKEQIILGVK